MTVKISAPRDAYFFSAHSWPGVELTSKALSWSRDHDIWMNLEYSYSDSLATFRACISVRLIFNNDDDAVFFVLSYEK